MRATEVINLLVNVLSDVVEELDKQCLWAGEHLEPEVDKAVRVGRATVEAAKELRLDGEIYTLVDLQDRARAYLATRDGNQRLSWTASDQTYGRQELERFFIHLKRQEIKNENSIG
jgi:hypothetical protein